MVVWLRDEVVRYCCSRGGTVRLPVDKWRNRRLWGVIGVRRPETVLRDRVRDLGHKIAP